MEIGGRKTEIGKRKMEIVKSEIKKCEMKNSPPSCPCFYKGYVPASSRDQLPPALACGKQTSLDMGFSPTSPASEKG